jgi:hypothetical protein
MFLISLALLRGDPARAAVRFRLSHPGNAYSLPRSLMIYSLKLETALILVGLLLIAAHAFALWKPQDAQAWLRAFPRSKNWGIGLVTAAAAWFFWLVWTMDLGEFSNWRQTVLILTPVAWLLTMKFVDEFLAVRALGMLALLAAEPLLESAFLRPEQTRLFLVTLVYVWIVFAMFWVGMPYTLRNQIGWVTANPKRWKMGALAGFVYGILLLVLPLTFGKPAP